MADLYLMCGVPGSGKSTFCREMVDHGVRISRDEIRYQLLGPYDKYFAKETMVKRKFFESIANYLNAGMDVYADATHLNHESRNNTVMNVQRYGGKWDNLNVVYIATPADICMERNAAREGITHVPDADMRRMINRFEEPGLWEGFNKIIVVKDDGEDIDIIER